MKQQPNTIDADAFLRESVALEGFLDRFADELAGMLAVFGAAHDRETLRQIARGEMGFAVADIKALSFGTPLGEGREL